MALSAMASYLFLFSLSGTSVASSVRPNGQLELKVDRLVNKTTTHEQVVDDYIYNKFTDSIFTAETLSKSYPHNRLSKVKMISQQIFKSSRCEGRRRLLDDYQRSIFNGQ